MEVLDHKAVVNPVECLRQIYQSQGYCMGSRSVNTGVDEMKKSDHVMGDGVSLKSSTVGRVKKWEDNWD